jgi:hypothetical protein
MSRLERIRSRQKKVLKEKEILERELQLLEHERAIIDMQAIFDENTVEINKFENMDVTGMDTSIVDGLVIRYDQLQDANVELHKEIYLSKQKLLQYNDEIIHLKEEVEELAAFLENRVEDEEQTPTVARRVEPIHVPGLVFDDSDELSAIRLGTLTLKNGTKIRAHFRNGVIGTISKLSDNKTTDPIDISEVGAYIIFSSLLDTSFYRMVHPFPTNSALIAKNTTPQHSYTSFLQGLKRTRNPVRLIALCHGLICPERSFNIKVIRLNNTAQGVCSFSSIREKHEYMSELIMPDTDQGVFMEKAKLLAKKNMHECYSLKLTTLTDEKRGSHFTISEADCARYNETYEACKDMKEPPFKEFGILKQQFNKTFQSNPGLCFLMVGYIPEGETEYVYMNLFALQPVFVLEDLIDNFISRDCQELYLADFSCAVPRAGFNPTALQKHSFGGRK